MEDQNPLTYKRSTLITSLQERLAEREKERADAKRKAEARNKKVRDQLVELMDEFPQFLIRLVEGVEDSWNRRPGTEAFGEAIRAAYAPAEVGVAPYDPDEAIKRLIRVYEKAEDDDVKVSVHDDVFRYL